ncbi:hypothetical protein ABT256_20305 [Amycolatopsis japonica]|uniref:hypothetical protein n=1 Tax=Amycolatopsis japonica TaxID=208439 RepID=UPI003333B77C
MSRQQHDTPVLSPNPKGDVTRRGRSPESVAGVAGAHLNPSAISRLQSSAGNQAACQMLAVQREPLVAGPSLDERYRAALRTATETGDFRNTAELLNGFNRQDILRKLAELTDEQVNYMHVGATSNPAVGPGSQIAELTRPGAPRASTAGPNSSQAPRPRAPVAQGPDLSSEQIAAMTPTERLVEAFHRADINAAVREKILSVLTPEALVAAVITFAAVFIASQFTPVGWAADIALGLTAVFIGTGLFRAANHLINFADARNATTQAEINAAGNEFARAVAEVEVDAILFLIMRTAGGGPRGGSPLPGPPPPGAGVVLATSRGQLVIVAVDTIPAAVASDLGITAGASAMAMSGGPRDKDYYEEKYGEGGENDMPRRQRISDGNKQELENSGWLRRRMPSEERRREFMEWLQRGHEQGEAHTHLRPGSREAEAAVREFEAENP